MAEMYYDNDADLSVLDDKPIAIVGYGSQGHAHALNLKDSGLDVRVGLYEGSRSWSKAVDDGLEVGLVADVSRDSDIIMVLIPDHTQAEVYRESVLPHLLPGKTLMFAHGFNIHYKTIQPPDSVDVSMVAPKAPETETDLFGEQSVLCGGVTALIKAAFETLVEAGYQPESAYFECMHELKLIVDLLYQGGMEYMRYSVSDTAEYGDYSRGPVVVDEHVKENMRKVLAAVQDGSFAREWIAENDEGRPRFNRLRRENAEHPIESVGKELRGMMSFLKDAD